jgi:hypothetical protein
MISLKKTKYLFKIIDLFEHWRNIDQTSIN